MDEDIRYWRGKRVTDMDAAELRTALAELYREHEKTLVVLLKERKAVAKVIKGKK